MELVFLLHSRQRCLAQNRSNVHSLLEVLNPVGILLHRCELTVHEIINIEALPNIVCIHFVSGKLKERTPFSPLSAHK
jgi:hypothetical protein